MRADHPDEGVGPLEADVGPEAYQQLLTAFLDHLSRQGAELLDAATVEDHQAVRYVAEQIKETAPSFGAHHLTGLAEDVALAGPDEGALLRSLIDDMAVEIARLQAVHGPSGRILVAEDNPVNQRVAVAMLENLGFTVDIAVNGADAVEATRVTSYRAILMDWQMPVMDGDEATGEIRRLQAGSRRTPIIAVTASATRSDQQRCLAAGMDDFLEKPLTLQALAATLDRWAPFRRDAAAVDAAEPLDTSTGRPRRIGAAPPVLDAEVVARLERLGESTGEDVVGQLSVLFLAEAEARVVDLRTAVSGNDAAAVARAAHTLRGASANLGASALSLLCSNLETAGLAGNGRSFDSQLEALVAELARVRIALASVRLTDDRVPSPAS